MRAENLNVRQGRCKNQNIPPVGTVVDFFFTTQINTLRGLPVFDQIVPRLTSNNVKKLVKLSIYLAHAHFLERIEVKLSCN